MTELQDRLDALEARFAEREPQVLAFLPEPGRFARLRAEAAALEARFPEPAARPPLFGVTLAVKDIFHVRGFVTRAGSQLPEAVLQGAEGDAVAALRQAGVLIAGKAVTTEFAFFGPGPTRNPRDPARTPGGSSSGSAAAVAAGLAELALGTQTIGSILRPASFCGVLGYKPSYERVPRTGVIPLAPSYDTVGLLANDVDVLTAGAAAIVGGWTPAAPARKPVLAIPEGPYLRRCDTVMEAAFRNTTTRLVRAGYTVISVPMFADFDAIRERHYALTAFEAAEVHRAWYAAHRQRYHLKTIDLIQHGQTVHPEAAQDARAARLALRAAVTEVMAAEGVDLWLSPAAVGAAPRGLEATGDPVMNLPWTQAGMPALCLPMAHDADGMPLGLQVAGAFGADEALLAWAADLHRDLARP